LTGINKEGSQSGTTPIMRVFGVFKSEGILPVPALCPNRHYELETCSEEGGVSLRKGLPRSYPDHGTINLWQNPKGKFGLNPEGGKIPGIRVLAQSPNGKFSGIEFRADSPQGESLARGGEAECVRTHYLYLYPGGKGGSTPLCMLAPSPEMAPCLHSQEVVGKLRDCARNWAHAKKVMPNFTQRYPTVGEGEGRRYYLEVLDFCRNWVEPRFCCVRSQNPAGLKPHVGSISTSQVSAAFG
jgi:hypothetical protein